MENEIAEMLETQIKDTLEELAVAETGSEKARQALIKLDKLHGQRIRELDAELKDHQRIDQRDSKIMEEGLRDRELTLKEKLAEEETKMKIAELEQKAKELEAKMKQTQFELELKKAELEAKTAQSAEDIRIKEAELEAKAEELKEAKRGRRWRTLLDIAGITIPVAASWHWMKKGMEFEETGHVYSSRTMQWLSSHFRLFGKKG